MIPFRLSLDVPMSGQLHRSTAGRVLLGAEEAGLQEVPTNGQHVLPRAEKGGKECVNGGFSSSVFAKTVSQFHKSLPAAGDDNEYITNEKGAQ